MKMVILSKKMKLIILSIIIVNFIDTKYYPTDAQRYLKAYGLIKI